MKKTPKNKDRLLHLNLTLSNLESTILLAALRNYLDRFCQSTAAPEIEALLYRTYGQLVDKVVQACDSGREKKP